jgi:hypothetical protein
VHCCSCAAPAAAAAPLLEWPAHTTRRRVDTVSGRRSADGAAAAHAQSQTAASAVALCTRGVAGDATATRARAGRRGGPSGGRRCCSPPCAARRCRSCCYVLALPAPWRLWWVADHGPSFLAAAAAGRTTRQARGSRAPACLPSGVCQRAHLVTCGARCACQAVLLHSPCCQGLKCRRNLPSLPRGRADAAFQAGFRQLQQIRCDG